MFSGANVLAFWQFLWSSYLNRSMGVIEKETCKLLKNKHNDIFCVRW